MGASVLYNNYAVTVAERQAGGYPVTAIAAEGGRATATVPSAGAELTRLLAGVMALPSSAGAETILWEAGVGLYNWLLAGSLQTHFRMAWDRAEQAGRGLRVRLTIDAPEINTWPWELLRDPARDHTFGTSLATPLMRYVDRIECFGLPMDLATELPLDLLLVSPATPGLDLAFEQAVIEQAVAPLAGSVNLHVLNGVVTRTRLSEKLMTGHYEIVHFSGHGGLSDGQSYIALNREDGTTDWVDSTTIVRLLSNHRSLKLGVLNACHTGRVDDAGAFSGLAIQLLRGGARAVVAMQMPLTDEASRTFAGAFYRQLCTGEHAGKVDVALAHARNMLAVLYPGTPCFAGPVLYTLAADGEIFALPREAAARAPLGSTSRRARMAMFVSSLQTSTDFDEDWALADPTELREWREALQGAERDYLAHIADPHPEVRQVAQSGLALVQARLAKLEEALALSGEY